MALGNTRLGNYILDNTGDVAWLRRNLPLATLDAGSGAPDEGEFAVPDPTSADPANPVWRRVDGTSDSNDLQALALPVWYRLDNTDVQELQETVALYGNHIAVVRLYENDVVGAGIGDPLYVSANGILTTTEPQVGAPVIARLEGVPAIAGDLARVRVETR